MEDIKGLGDQIEKITTATGIKKLVKWAFGEDCGCEQRKEKLNKLFPRRRKPECLNEEEYNYLTDIKLEKFNGATRLTAEAQRKILTIYNRVFKAKKQFSTCGSCVISMINEMKTLMKSYGN
jgi:hypothetical protein